LIFNLFLKSITRLNFHTAPNTFYLCPISILFSWGNLADSNRVSVKKAADIFKYFPQLVFDILDNIPQVDVLSLPSTQGSYKINFELVPKKEGNMYSNIEPFEDYFNESIKYLFKYFTNEYKQLLSGDVFSDNILLLVDKLNLACENTAVKKPQDIHKHILDTLLKSAKTLAVFQKISVRVIIVVNFFILRWYRNTYCIP
jgi:hypothetical protein